MAKILGLTYIRRQPDRPFAFEEFDLMISIGDTEDPEQAIHEARWLIQQATRIPPDQLSQPETLHYADGSERSSKAPQSEPAPAAGYDEEDDNIPF